MNSEYDYIIGMGILMIAVVVSMVMATRLEHKLKARLPHTRPYQWGFFLGCMGFWFGPATLGISALCGWGIIKRRRWAWVVGTLLTMNPLAWIVNGVYAGHRWQEFTDEASGLRSSKPRNEGRMGGQFNEMKSAQSRKGSWMSEIFG